MVRLKIMGAGNTAERRVESRRLNRNVVVARISSDPKTGSLLVRGRQFVPDGDDDKGMGAARFLRCASNHGFRFNNGGLSLRSQPGVDLLFDRACAGVREDLDL